MTTVDTNSITPPNTTATPIIVIQDVREVDDAGGTHLETRMTAEFLVDLIERGILKFEGNIRPDHNPERRMGAKTSRKILRWAEELNRNDAVIGNISIRLDPASSDMYYEADDFNEDQTNLVLNKGQFDTAVDSQSRIRAIHKAAKSPAGTFDLKTRFAVRIWLADDPLAKRVASDYNTRGDKVNDTAAKFAHQSSPSERMAKKLMMESAHLGLDNVEVFTNTVSASSQRLMAFNTLAQAIEGSWQDVPMDEAEEDEQVKFLVDFWNALVKVRPEFGRLSLKDRRELRGTSVAGTALSIHGIVAVADTLWNNEIALSGALDALNDAVPGKDGTLVDYLSYQNPVWESIGVIVPSTNAAGESTLTLRMSFQTRSAIGKQFKAKLGLVD